MRLRSPFFLTLVALAFIAQPVSALDIPGSGGALTISMAPAHPAPGQSVELSLSSPLYDLDNSSIIWTVNGRAYQSGAGVSAITLTTGASGEETDVTASISGASGDAATQVVIIPTTVDLLWESDSYTPPLYRGRSLPSAGSHVTLVAIPHFLVGKTVIDPGTLTYTWRVDGDPVKSASGRGKSSARFDAPTLYGSDSYSVEVTSQGGAVSGSASVRLSDTKPRILLYEDTPLFGILFNQALSASPFVPDAEMTFFAAPLYAPTGSARASTLSYDWTVNQSPVIPDAKVPNEITVNAAKSSGIANISLDLSDTSDYFFGANASWQVTFTKQGGGSATSNDPFHSQ